MSTRSIIGRLYPDGSMKTVYCHSDGYPSWNGSILLTHWQDPEKLEAMLAQGDMSSLGRTVGVKHSFEYEDLQTPEFTDPETHQEIMCRFYGRDRGETDVDAITFANRRELFEHLHDSDREYVYLLAPSGRWLYYSKHYHNDGRLRWLSPERCALKPLTRRLLKSIYKSDDTRDTILQVITPEGRRDCSGALIEVPEPRAKTLKINAYVGSAHNAQGDYVSVYEPREVPRHLVSLH